MDVYTDLVHLANDSTQPSQSEDEVEEVSDSKKPKHDTLLDYHESSSDTDGSGTPDYDKIEREVSQFKAEEIDNTEEPLEWWKLNQHRFPILSSMAKKYLCIPATSVPCERLFSDAGTVVDRKRCSLDPNNVDCLLFLHCNL